MHIGEITEVGTIEPLVIPRVVPDGDGDEPASPADVPTEAPERVGVG
jgi:hypothetical protein